MRHCFATRRAGSMVGATGRLRRGFTLIETITVVVIASMMVVSVTTVYINMQKNAAKMNSLLDEGAVAEGLCQRIAEDFDRIVSAGLDARVSFQSKYVDQYLIVRLEMENAIYGAGNKREVYERVVWQSDYDPFEGGIVVYRSHTGIAAEDRLVEVDMLDEEGFKSEEVFVPVVSGLTLFSIETPKRANELTPYIDIDDVGGDDDDIGGNSRGGRSTGVAGTAAGEVWEEDIEYLSAWQSPELPKVVVVRVSFAEPFETAQGELAVWPEDIVSRTIAVDTSREMTYRFVKKEFDVELDEDDKDDGEPNDVDDDYGTVDGEQAGRDDGEGAAGGTGDYEDEGEGEGGGLVPDFRERE